LGAGSSGITWYDVLGLLPGATADQVQRQYESKARLVRPELVAGAPSPVVEAASRAQEILSAARRVLADPANRARYDQAVGIRRGGGGLARRGGFPSQPGPELPDVGFIAGDLGSEAVSALLALSDWLAPHPQPPGRVAVPDVRGLFYSVCLGITGKLGLRVTAVRLTEHPMPVDGLVIDQSPRSPAKTRRGSALTVHVWHAPVRKLTGSPCAAPPAGDRRSHAPVRDEKISFSERMRAPTRESRSPARAGLPPHGRHQRRHASFPPSAVLGTAQGSLAAVQEKVALLPSSVVTWS
jgi:hypothetical protein